MTGKKMGQFHGIQRMCMDQENNEIFTTDCYNDRIQVFSESLKPQRQYKVSQNPYGICLTPSNIFICCVNSICVHDRDMNFIHSIDIMGPKDITVSRDSNMVVTTLYGCEMLSPNGEKLRNLERFDPNFFKGQDGICTDSRGRIIVSNLLDGKLDVFDKDGQFIFSFGSQGDTNGCLHHPRGVCTNALDDIFVCDSLNKRVGIFSPEGKFIRNVYLPNVLNGRGASPTGVVTSGGNMFISDFNCDCICRLTN